MKYEIIIDLLKKKELLEKYEEKSINIDYLSYDSRDIKENTLFFCKGFDFKEEYLDEAIKKGILVYASEKNYHKDVPCILVNNIQKTMSLIGQAFYKDNLALLGVTGTKGKTTVISYINNIMNEKYQKKTGFITTINLYTGKREQISLNTTPEGLDLHRYLHEMEESDLKVASLEVSSQATKMNRIYNMKFKVGCFLNIGEDHISPHEHSDFNDYFNCKVEFLKMCEEVILYKHTDYYDEIREKLGNQKVITYGLTEECDYYVKDIVKENGMQAFTIVHDGKEENYTITMPGKFNVLNATCAVIVGKIMNASYEIIKKALYETKVVGRVEIYQGICPIIVDYAHNKLSFEHLLNFVKEDYPDKNIKVIIGCPGDKGFARRRDLSTLSAMYAKHIYLTAVDPQHKTVQEICEDMATFIKPYNTPYDIITDREEAIKKAISDCNKDDILLITCKGNEEYQLVGSGVETYKSDKKVVEEVLSLISERK